MNGAPPPSTDVSALDRAIVAVRRWSRVELGDDFVDYQRRLTLRYGEFLTVLFLAGLIIGWPTDRWFFNNNEMVVAALRRWRLWTVLFSMLVLLIAWLLRRRAQWILPVVTAVALVQAALVADLHARAGGLDGSWFHYSYLMPLVMLPLPLPLTYRTVATIGVSGSYVASFFVTAPWHANHPLVATSLTTLAFVTLGAIGMGHQVSRLVRASFRQRLQLAQRANDLEQRVAERTRSLQQLSTHLLTTREQERRRIARELHDELAQTLTVLRLELRLARRACSNEMSDTLSRLDNLVSCAFDAKERIIAALHPASIDELGLGGAIREGASRLQLADGPTIEVIVMTPLPLHDRDVATAAYRVVQEALNNAVRHANARCIKVVLHQTDDQLRVSIKDDGHGFDVAAVDSGFGLQGMRERARSLGGVLELDALSSGTQVQLRLPLTVSAGADEH